MRKKSFLLFVILCCITLLVACVFVACNPGSGEQTGQPGEGDGGKDETMLFTVTFDTQGGSKIADIKVESGHIVGEFTLPAKQCARLVGFALDADGEQMWDILTDKVSADITLYAIWEDAHDWGEWVVTTPATCTEDGEKTRTCNACGETEKEVVPAAHTWGEWETVTDPTCTTDGTQKRVCEVCGKEGTGSMPALGHDFEEEYTVDVEPDCETKGSESRHCTRCDATTDSREIAALGHNFTRFEYDDEGHLKICSRCNGISEKTPHVYDESGKCECGAIEVTPDSEFTFAKLDDGTYSVTRYTGTRRYVRIPSAHDGAMVTSIGDYAFWGCSGLTSIAIPDSVTSIGSYAFSVCTGLTSVTIGNGVTSIGWDAFSGCSGLTSITIPDSVTSIGSSAFSGCSGLTSIAIPDSVTSIGSSAFSGCYKLVEVYNKSKLNIVAGSSGNGYVAYYAKNVYTEEGGSRLTIDSGGFVFYYDGATGYLVGHTGNENELVLPDGFIAYNGVWVNTYEINGCAFYNCTGLTSIVIPDSVTSIGSSAFSGCSGLTSIYYTGDMQSWLGKDWHGLIMSSGRTLYINGNKVAGAVVIPDGITSIPSYAFAYQTDITSVTIPDSVTSIGSSAFYGCSGLTSVYYTGDVAGWCGISGLDEVMSSGRTLYINGNKVAGAVVIPDGITSIPSYAFAYQTDITSVTIPNSVTSIGAYAFSGCSGLTSITVAKNNAKYHSVENCLIEIATKTLVVGCKTSVIPDDGSVTSIGEGAFSGCSGLTSIAIPDSVTSIGYRAFDCCSSLTSITIPDSVTSIGSNAFSGCSGLTLIYYTGDVAGWCGISGLGYIMSSGRTLYINGNKVAGAIVIPDGITSIPSYAFAYQTDITSVTIPDSVTSIGEGAFRGCSSLTSATFENTSGWQVSSSSDFGSYTDLSSDSLSNASLVATSLKLLSFYWRRV